MANSFSTAYRTNGLRITGWLLFAATAGALTIAVWIASAVKPAASHKQKTAEIALPPDPLIKLSTTNPNEMATAVKPISFDAVVRDMRNYPPQFTDSRYLKSNEAKWTIQIMNVAEHEVVTDYLNARDDKDNFKYFRIIDEHNQKRYVVTYGLYGSSQEAMAASKTINFGLPSNVTAFPEEVRSYLAQVDEYEVNAPVTNLGAKAPKEVKLHSTPKVIAAPAVASAKPKAKAEDTKANDAGNANNDTPTTNSDKATTATAPVSANTARLAATKPAVPTRPAPREETLVIQDKPVPSFVEKPVTHKNDSNQDSRKAPSKAAEVAEKPKKTEAPTKSDRMSDLIKEKSQ